MSIAGFSRFGSQSLESLWYILAWILLSSSVIVFNKWILDRFPFSISITTWHMFFATVATQVLARTTTLIDTKTEISVRKYLTAVLPIGMCFSMSLILSNLVYLYLSMSFIQILKAAGPVATLLACWSMGIRNPEPSVQVFVTVCVIVAGVAISSWGEVRFVFTGFLIQAAAVGFEAYKNALQQSLLGGKSKMSSMTLLYYFAPACTVINALFILIFEFRNLTKVKSTHISTQAFLANGALTFALNIASVTVIKKTSSVVLTLSGIPKSIMICVFDMLFYRCPMTLTQVVGFSIAGVGTYRYSRIAQAPNTEFSVKVPAKDLSLFKTDEESQQRLD